MAKKNPKTFRTPKSLLKHQAKYRPGALMEYTEPELASIIAYKAKLATHKVRINEALKEIQDGRNYLDMLEVKIKGQNP